MRELPWLVRSSDRSALRRRERERTLLAGADLRRYAEVVRPHGLYLVIHDSVDIAFDLQPWDLPADAVDARRDDAVRIALTDPSAVLITAGGIFIGEPATSDDGWFELVGLGRTQGELGSSALSGRYLGFVAKGAFPVRYPPAPPSPRRGPTGSR